MPASLNNSGVVMCAVKTGGRQALLRNTIMGDGELFERGSHDPSEYDIQVIATHYRSYHKRWRLKPPEREMIVEALKIYDVDSVKLAIDGLHRSDFHQGKNDRGKKYLAIKYAIKWDAIDGWIEEAEAASRRLKREQEAKSEKPREEKREAEERQKMMKVSRTDSRALLRKAMRDSR